MNRIHLFYCSREAWKRHVREDLVPAATDGVDLGDEVLEVGPGFGAATDALVEQAPHLTAVEIDPSLAEPLRERLGHRVEVRQGDGTDLPFADDSFSGAVCFTMLHHVPTPALQDRLFAEVLRVVRPGGVFAGTDSTAAAWGSRCWTSGTRRRSSILLRCPSACGPRASTAPASTGGPTPCASAPRERTGPRAT